MTTPEIDDLMSANEHFTALLAADVSLDLGLDQRPHTSGIVLERANAAIARSVSRGTSLYNAVEECATTPIAYRSLVLAWLRSGDFTATLDCSHELATQSDESRFALRASFYYPLLICTLAYVGAVGFCIYLVPTLSSLYDSPDIRPGPWLRLLQSMRETLPYWIAVPPVLILLALYWNLRSPRHKNCTARLPWRQRIGSAHQRTSTFAELVADLLEAETSRDEALSLAASACGFQQVNLQEPTSATSVVLPSLPPLLHWALYAPEAASQRPAMLRAAANVYRDTARVRKHRVLNTASFVIFLVLGGGATLAYGLMLFLPVVETLRALSRLAS